MGLLIWIPFNLIALYIAFKFIRVTHIAPDGRSFTFLRSAIKTEFEFLDDENRNAYFDNARVMKIYAFNLHAEVWLGIPVLCYFKLVRENYKEEMAWDRLLNIFCAPMAILFYLQIWLACLLKFIRYCRWTLLQEQVVEEVDEEASHKAKAGSKA